MHRSKFCARSASELSRAHPSNEHRLDIKNPATGELIAQCHAASAEDVQEAIAVAEFTFKSGKWSRQAPAARAAVMSKIAKLFQEQVKDLAYLESLQTGRPLREMTTQLGRLSEWFEVRVDDGRCDIVSADSQSVCSILVRELGRRNVRLSQ